MAPEKIADLVLYCLSCSILARTIYGAGERRGFRRGAATHPPPVFRRLPCFGGPLDGQTVMVDEQLTRVRLPQVVKHEHAAWEEGDPIGGLPLHDITFRQALYVRLWMGDREQLVYQGASDA